MSYLSSAQQDLSNKLEHWGTLGSIGEHWGMLGGIMEHWGTFGNVGEHWEALENVGKLTIAMVTLNPCI